MSPSEYNNVQLAEDYTCYIVEYKSLDDEDNIMKESFPSKEEAIQFINELNPYCYCETEVYAKTYFKVIYPCDNTTI